MRPWLIEKISIPTMPRLYLAILLSCLVLSCKTSIQKSEHVQFLYQSADLPKSTGVVTDLANLYTSSQTDEFRTLIQDFEKETSNEIALVTVTNIHPYEDLAIFTTDLANHWGVGKESSNNGLVFCIYPEKRKLWISTGFETEKILTD
ncbi:hypothetical protein GCM10009117_11180 [Gangjinia marincola]|uniref:TPM domain-containing protein n=1 Tax=Gangjinia marincola TaxID=578463 RepID=A0ABP3XUJ8_9FLAO